MNVKKKIACYCRVSTTEQNTDSQLEAIRKYCSNQGWEIAKVYKDEGVSGAKDDRPALNELKKDCLNQKRGWTAIVVFRFDRMARSTQHLLECLNLFQKHKIDFISINEGIDTSTSVGRMVFTFLGGIAEFERAIIRERVTSGIERAKAQGVKIGRPRAGFDINGALKLKREGLSWAELSKRVGVSVGTLRRVIPALLKTHEKGHALKP